MAFARATAQAPIFQKSWRQEEAKPDTMRTKEERLAFTSHVKKPLRKMKRQARREEMLANSMSTKSLYPEHYVKGTDNSVRRQIMSVFNKQKIWIVTSWKKTEEMRRLPVAREMQVKYEDTSLHPGPEPLGRKVAQHRQR